MGESINSVLETLGETTLTTRYDLGEQLREAHELEVKFSALEALSELDRPKTIRAMKEILRIFID